VEAPGQNPWRVTALAAGSDRQGHVHHGRKQRDGNYLDSSSGTAFANDAALVAACLAGTPGAFATLMEQQQRRIYNLCYRFVGNHEDASDLSQEVFLRVHRRLHRFQGGAAFSTWLYRIAVNVSLNHVGVKPLSPTRSSRGASSIGVANRRWKWSRAVSALRWRERRSPGCPTSRG
jgi:hypothetical protein